MATGESEELAAARCAPATGKAPVSAVPSTTVAAQPAQAQYAPSDIRHDNPVPALPFYGSRVVKDIPLDAVYPYIDEVALFRGQWQFKSGTMSRDEFRRWTQENVQPIFTRIKQKCRDLQVLNPQVVYGYFYAQSDKNDLIIYHQDQKTPRLRFHFPRQPAKKRWCLADFFHPVESGKMDVVAMQCVTAGPQMALYEKQLFAQGDFTEYLYMHGIGVQIAEALAEMWHKRVRQEWGIAGRDGPTMRDIFACHFQGCRYSFGYPACPDLQDEEKLFSLLDPSRIGCTLSENWMIQPEQSTSALIVHHPDARYFNVD